MSIETLRADVKKLTELPLEPIPDDTLSRLNPAYVSESGDIHIYSRLSEAEQAEAEGHELAHLWLEYNGLIVVGGNIMAPCHFSNPEYEDIYEWMPHLNFLALEVTMAIHHPKVFQITTAHGISNDLQITSRFTPLDEMIRILDGSRGFAALHHAYGFQLYDVANTIQPLEDYLKEIRRHFPEVTLALDAAREFIPQVNASLSLQAQLALCQQAVGKLGYDETVLYTRNRLRHTSP